MTTQIDLSPDLAVRLDAEAARRGVSPGACATEVLDRHLPPAARSAALQADFDAWAAEDQASGEDESADEVFRALDEDRPADRKLFPEELKGISW